MVTPLLDRLRTQGGTLYTFSSASRDLTKTFTSNNYEFKFSNFACLNLPNFKSGKYNKYTTTDKGIYLETLKDIVEWNADNMNISLAEHLQNYVMNFETLILNGDGDNDDYNNDLVRSVSERIFFNWLQKVGGIDFNGNQESGEKKNRTVQYIGNIDITNTVEINGDAFDELYLYVPGNEGASNVKFLTIDDDNYFNKNFNCSSEKIIGRDSLKDEDKPYELSLDAIFDKDAGGNVYIGDDGYCIDFRDDTYNGITNMNYESGLKGESFEFNCILLYYTFKDNSNPLKPKSATNLYGVLFLEEITDIRVDNIIADNTDENLTQGYIQRYPKIAVPGSNNGNSFALKVDLKIDTMPDYTMHSEFYIDPNSAASMVLYNKAMTKLQDCVDIFYTQQKEISMLQERIDFLEEQLTLIDQIEDIKDTVMRLQDRMDYSDPIVDGKSLKSLIDENSKGIRSLVSGKLPAMLHYDVDLIKNGYGINITKTDKEVIINNDISSYSINEITNAEGKIIDINNKHNLGLNKRINKDITIRLRPGANLSVLYLTSDYCNSNFNIFIDESDYQWRLGQKLTLKVFDSLIFDEYVYGTNYVRPEFSIKSGYDNNYKDIFVWNNVSEKTMVKDNLNGLKQMDIICISTDVNEKYSNRFIIDTKIN